MKAWLPLVAVSWLLVDTVFQAGAAPGIIIPARSMRRTPKVIAFGDSRFTEPSNTTATSPGARRALVARIAHEKPDAIFVTGDLVWHGLPEDYQAFHDETTAWRELNLRVFPALGNHEFQRCGEVEACVANWRAAFPDLPGERWYSVQLGPSILLILLDSDDSLEPGSVQRTWLEAEVAAVPASVRFVVVGLHHPAVTGIEDQKRPDHARPNEMALREYLKTVDATATARYLVVGGHIHNYARFLWEGMTYLVTGGGGGTPAGLDRGPTDLYRNPPFPNYHFVAFDFGREAVKGTMWRLVDPEAETPVWEVRDRFEVKASRAGRTRE